MTQEALKQIEQKMTDVLANLDKKYSEASQSIEKGEEVTNELKSQIINLQGEVQKAVDAVRDLEEKGGVGRNQIQHKGLAQLIGESPEYKSRTSSTVTQIEIKGDDYKHIEKKALVTAGGSNLIVPEYDRTIEAAPRSELLIRDLLPSIPVTSSQFTYFQEVLGRTNAAGMVAEGGRKPEGAVSFAAVTDRVKKIAEWIPITEEAASDIPQLVAFINEMLGYDIRFKEEEQLLKGDGTGENLNGIMTQAVAYDPTLMKAGTGDTKLDTLRRMIAQVRHGAKRSADFITMSEIDLVDIELMKDASNKYLFANIQGSTTPWIWGRPVVVSDVMDDATGEVLVGHSRSAMIYDLMSLIIKIGQINDDFVKNQFVVLAEKRLGLAVRRKQGFVKHQFTPAEQGE